MDNLTLDQYKQLRRQGFDKEQVQDLRARGRVQETLQKETFKQKGFFRSAAEFLGVSEFGRGIGQTIYNATGQREKIQEQMLSQDKQTTDNLIAAVKEGKAAGRDTATLEQELQKQAGSDVNYKEMATGGLSNHEVTGSAINTALVFTSLLGGGVTKTAVSKVPALAGKGLVKAGVRGAITGAGEGAAFASANAITEGKPVAPAAAKGAALGAAVNGTLSTAGQYISNLAKITPESRLIAQKDAYKTLQRNFNAGAVYRNVGGKRELVSDPISTIVQAKLPLKVIDGKVNTEEARTAIRELITAADDKVTEAVKNPEIPGVSLGEFRKLTVDMVKSNKNLQAGGKVGKVVKQLESYFGDYASSYGDDLSTETVSTIRQAMNKSYNPDTVDVERALGDAARKVVYKNAPGARELLAREGQLIKADQFLDALQGRAVKGGRLGGYFANLVGAIAGSTTGVPVAGPIVGALGARKVADVAQKQSLNPILPKVARLIEKLPTDTAGKISKTAILEAIGKLSNE